MSRSSWTRQWNLGHRPCASSSACSQRTRDHWPADFAWSRTDCLRARHFPRGNSCYALSSSRSSRNPLSTPKHSWAVSVTTKQAALVGDACNQVLSPLVHCNQDHFQSVRNYCLCPLTPCFSSLMFVSTRSEVTSHAPARLSPKVSYQWPLDRCDFFRYAVCHRSWNRLFPNKWVIELITDAFTSILLRSSLPSGNPAWQSAEVIKLDVLRQSLLAHLKPTLVRSMNVFISWLDFKWIVFPFFSHFHQPIAYYLPLFSCSALI